MSEKDELKKRKLKKPKKSKPEDEYSGKHHIPRPRPHIRSGADIELPSQEPITIVPPTQQQPEEPKQTGVVLEKDQLPSTSQEEKIDEGAFVDYLPTEKEMTEIYIDYLRETGTFGSATLSVLRYVLSNEYEKNKDLLLSNVSKNAEEINNLLQTIANEIYEYANFVASANQIIELISSNPAEYYEMLNEAAQFDSSMAESVIHNAYKD